MTRQLLATLGVSAVDLRTYTGGRYAVIQRDPQPDEAGIPATTGIYLRLVDLEGDPTAGGGEGWGHAPWGQAPWGHAPAPALACTVDVAGVRVLTYTAAGATWDPAWTGSVTPSAPPAPYVYCDIAATPLAPPIFISEQAVLVRVVVFPGTPPALDCSYTFTIADSTAPSVAALTAVAPAVMRVTFSEPMAVVGAGSALDPAAYALTARNVPPLPGVAATVIAVAAVADTADTTFDLTCSWELTPGCRYDLEVSAAVTDAAGNALQ
jgi:hypothetical protein